MSSNRNSWSTPMSSEPPFNWPKPVIPPRKQPTHEEEQSPDYIKLILNARVYDVCQETPLTLASKVGFIRAV
jgi:threonine dehydratase